MGNSLNNAFVRAYAKNRQSHQPSEPLAATVEPTMKASVGSSNPAPAATAAAPRTLASFPVTPVTYVQSPATTVPVRPELCLPQVAIHAHPESTLRSSQMASSPALSPPSTGSHRSTAATAQYEDIDAVLRRIDQAAATPFVAPHTSPRPTNQVGVAVGAQTNNVAKRLQAAAPPSAASQPTSSRPVLVASPQEQLPVTVADARPSIETHQDRRKSILDYLYAAGQVPTKSLPTQLPAARVPPAHMNSIDIQRLVSSSIVDAWNGSSNPAVTPTSVAVTRPIATHVDASTSISTNSARSATKFATPSFVDNYAQKPPSRLTAGHAPSMLPNYEVVQPTTTHIAPGILPSQHVSHPATIGSRQGEILRVDIPSNLAQTDNSVSTSSAASKPANKQPAVDSVSPDMSARAATVERNLRLAKTRVFNPVWEVDELQWPHVCRQLMQQRASDLADVAENLKTACQDGLQVLGITSSSSGEGTTTVASCLALLCAQYGLKVVLIDGNVATPALCAHTNLEIEADWLTSIIEQMPLEEIAVHSITDQLTLIPLNGDTTHEKILPSDQRIAHMIRELSDSFDLVIIDVGSISSSSALITNLARENVFDAAMVVVDRRRAEQRSVDNCITRIQHTGISSIGIVENFAA